MPCVSLNPKPSYSGSCLSALPSPSVSVMRQMFGIEKTIAVSPLASGFRGKGWMPMGMFSFSAKISTFRARPSGAKSLRTRTLSLPASLGCGALSPTRNCCAAASHSFWNAAIGCPFTSVFAGHGYSSEPVTQSRPAPSKVMFIGF